MIEIHTLAFMETKEILSHLNAAKFFSKYLPHIKRYKQKLSGKDSNGKQLDFTDTEKKEIIKAVKQFVKDITLK